MAKDESLENQITTAVADGLGSVVDTPQPKDDSDAKADLYVRKIIDGVTKSIAELLKPTPAPEEPEEVKRKRMPKPAPAPVVKKLGFTLFG